MHFNDIRLKMKVQYKKNSVDEYEVVAILNPTAIVIANVHGHRVVAHPKELYL